MRTFAACMLCQRELGYPSFEPFFVEYFDDGVGYVECSAGHRSALVLQSPKFEMLLESGANALLDGHTLEACASFGAALERFREFCLRVMAAKYGADAEFFDSAFRELSRHSERQLGAFLILYALNARVPYRLDRKIQEFRNSVIHKGKIPNREEAVDFCERVHVEICDVLGELHERYPEEIRQATIELVTERGKNVEAGVPRVTSSGCLFFSAIPPLENRPFREALDSYRSELERLVSAAPLMRAMSASIRERQAPT